jgi:hypothetical protein
MHPRHQDSNNQITPQEPVDPNTTPSPHPRHHHTSDSENTQVIGVRKQGERTKKKDGENKIIDTN